MHRPLPAAVKVDDGELTLVCPLGDIGQGHAIGGKTGAGQEQVDLGPLIGGAMQVDDITEIAGIVCIGGTGATHQKAGRHTEHQGDSGSKTGRKKRVHRAHYWI